MFHTFFCFTYFVFCVFVSLTAVRISRSVYFFTSNVLLIQVYLRSDNSQRLVAVVFPVYKLCIKINGTFEWDIISGFTNNESECLLL